MTEKPASPQHNPQPQGEAGVVARHYEPMTNDPRRAKFNPHRSTWASFRPLKRGKHPCLIGCGQTFSTPGAAAQHTRDKHGKKA